MPHSDQSVNLGPGFLRCQGLNSAPPSRGRCTLRFLDCLPPAKPEGLNPEIGKFGVPTAVQADGLRAHDQLVSVAGKLQEGQSTVCAKVCAKIRPAIQSIVRIGLGSAIDEPDTPEHDEHAATGFEDSDALRSLVPVQEPLDQFRESASQHDD